LIDAAFGAAGLAILHVPAKRSYVADDIASRIAQAVGSGMPQKRTSQEARPQTEIPLCPRCDIEMVARRASRGRHKGKQFWACPSYPDCKEIVSID
jgi:hypothetical protein